MPRPPLPWGHARLLGSLRSQGCPSGPTYLQEAPAQAAGAREEPSGSREGRGLRGPAYLWEGCSLLFMHRTRQQVRKATDMSRMIAQLTVEAITATLKPKVSYGGTAAGRQGYFLRGARPGSRQALLHGWGAGRCWWLGPSSVQNVVRAGLSGNTAV